MTELDDDEIFRMSVELEKSLTEGLKKKDMETIDIKKEEDKIVVETKRDHFDPSDEGKYIKVIRSISGDLPSSVVGGIFKIAGYRTSTTVYIRSSSGRWAINIRECEFAPEEEYLKLFEKYEEQLNTYKKILEDVFPERWDIWTENENIDFVIHFPIINITNSQNIKHVIRDIYVILPFRQHNFNLLATNRRTYAFRGTVTEDEHFASYLYSHINGGKLHQIISSNRVTRLEMCLGNAQPLGSEFAHLISDFNPDKFLSSCLQIESFLSWESLEGGPYVKISTINKREEYINITPPSIYTSLPVSTIIKNIDSLEFDNVGNKLMLNADSLEKLLLNNIIPVDSYSYKDIVLLKNPDTNMYYKRRLGSSSNDAQEVNSINEHLKKNDIMFRGSRIDFKIIKNTDNEIKMTLVNAINPNYLRITMEQFNNLIN